MTTESYSFIEDKYAIQDSIVSDSFGGPKSLSGKD